MTLLTYMIILSDEKVLASSYGPVHGKFGIYIHTLNYGPSGSEWPRTLLTSKPTYATAEEAKAAAEEIVAKVKANGDSAGT